MKERQIKPMIIALTIFLVSIGCASCQNKVEGIKAKLDEGVLWHDVELTNESGKDLHEVKIAISLTGENGDVKSESRYFAVWPNGRKQRVSFEIKNSPRNVQKIEILGKCDEGSISSYWIPKSG